MKEELSKEGLEEMVRARHNEKRIDDLESDMNNIKPIVYSTANDVKTIAKSVEKMEANSDKMRGYLLGGVITGVLSIVFIAIKQLLGI